MPNPLSRYPGWLHRALGLTEPELPVQLSTRELLPVVDTLQGGWGAARWVAGSWTSTEDDPAQTRAIEGLTAQEDARLLHAVDVLHEGGAGAGLITLDLYDPILNITVVLAEVSVPADDFAAWSDWRLPGPIYVPPGFAIQTTLPARAVGETYTIRWVGGSISPGAKAI